VRRTSPLLRLLGAVTVVAAVALGLVSCADESPAAAPPKGRLTVGSADAPESRIIASMYAEALRKAGYDVTERLGGSRKTYLAGLESGALDAVPEYIGSLTEYYDAVLHGPDAPTRKPLASGDPDRTYATLEGLVARHKLAVLTPSPATNQVAVVVTKAFADDNGLKTVSDLAAFSSQLVFGAGPDCERRRTCLPGLRSTYGLTFKEVRRLAAGDDATFEAFSKGTIQVGLVSSSAGGIASVGLVVLRDDRQLQTADNITALVRDTVPAEARHVIDRVDRALTTEKLQELNQRLRAENADPEKLADRFLRDAGLL